MKKLKMGTEKKVANCSCNVSLISFVVIASPIIQSSRSWLFGVEAEANSTSQNNQRNQELEDLNDELCCFVLVVMRLLWRSVLYTCWDGWRIDFSYIILVQHCSSTTAVSDILKIISCILPCIQQPSRAPINTIEFVLHLRDGTIWQSATFNWTLHTHIHWCIFVITKNWIRKYRVSKIQVLLQYYIVLFVFKLSGISEMAHLDVRVNFDIQTYIGAYVCKITKNWIQHAMMFFCEKNTSNYIYLLQTTKHHHHLGDPPRILSHHTPVQITRDIWKN